MNGERIKDPTIYDQWPEAAVWINNVLDQEVKKVIPEDTKQDIIRITKYISAFMGAPAKTDLRLIFDMLWSDSLERTTCSSCGQEAVVDISVAKCPKCSKSMVMRQNKTNGSKFLGCTGYPGCRGSRTLESLLLDKLKEVKQSKRIVTEELRRIEL